jgi:hypothetical protein
VGSTKLKTLEEVVRNLYHQFGFCRPIEGGKYEQLFLSFKKENTDYEYFSIYEDDMI